MADVKISALPAATTPLGGTEVLPIVQSGTTKKVSIADVTAGRALSASSLTLTSPLAVASGGTGATTSTGTGSVVLGTSPAITFPAGTVGAPAITTTGDINTGIYFPAADTIGFVEGGTESMRLDASGNLGLGVTPSAYNSNTRALDFNVGCVETNFGNSFGMWFNTFYNSGGNYIYKTSQAAAQYIQSGGGHAWFNAPSGIAGNAISFTQAMTLDASGNLGIGTSPPSTRLHVVSSGSGVDSARFSDGVTSTLLIRHFASGSVAALDAYGTLGLMTGGTERARIDSSGNLLVGTTSSGAAATGMVFNYASGAGSYLDIGHPSSAGSGYSYVIFRYNSTQIGSIAQDGTTAVLYNTTSDIALKENIADANSSLASILALPIRQFDWKAGGHTDYGVVAQEANEYAPEIVSQGEMWAVDYGRITPRLIKAFQELAAEIATLKEQLNG